MHGIGIYSDADGNARTGRWENDKRIEWIDEEHSLASSMIVSKNYCKNHFHKDEDFG